MIGPRENTSDARVELGGPGALLIQVIGLSPGNDCNARWRRDRSSGELDAQGLGRQGLAEDGLSGVGNVGDVGNDEDDPEVIIARRNAEHRRMQAKLRAKRKKESRLELERMRALEEKAEVSIALG